MGFLQEGIAHAGYTIRWNAPNLPLKELLQGILRVSIMEYFWDVER
jgi:hypothetical protein